MQFVLFFAGALVVDLKKAILIEVVITRGASQDCYVSLVYHQ